MKKILVIDDDAAIQSLTVKALQSRGYQALIAGDGEEGLAAARRYLPDLIVCDVQMPNMDGYETLAALQRDPTTCAIPFVFLTGLSDQRLVRYGMGLGADDYLTKPFTVSELVNAVSTRLAKKEAVQKFSEKKLEELRDNIGLALPHELLTPLNGILGLAGMLADADENTEVEELREMARSIQYSAFRLHRLIFNFIVYSELELIGSDAKKLAEMLKDARCAVVESVVSAAREKAESLARLEDLQVEIETCEVAMASERLAKVVEELTDNALKFSKAGSPVRIWARPEDKFCVLEIMDRGRGMSLEQIASIGAHMQFERRFYEQQGAGLGLVISKRIAELHGGDLSIQSVPGQETRVRVLIPLVRPPQSE